MKSRKEIKTKLAQVRYRHLKRALRTGLSRKPENCMHNAKLGLGSKPDSPRVGVCMFGVEEGAGPRGVCDECFGGRNRAAECDDFEVIRDAAEIRKDFEGFLNQASKGEIAFHYPDMAALMWALGDHPSLDDVIPDDEVEREEAAEDEVVQESGLIQIEEPPTVAVEQTVVSAPWFVRAWHWLRSRFV